MNKAEFLAALKNELAGLSKEEADERLNFYSEMIDDLMEEGLTEAEAIEKIGSVGDIVTQLHTDDAAPLKSIKSRRQLSALEIILHALGSPIWLALIIAVLSVVISGYVVLWSLVVSFWAIFASLVGCSVGGVGMLFTECINGNTASGIAMLGIGLTAAGLAIFTYHGCIAATKAAAWLTGKSFLLAISVFSKKEEVK